MKQTVYFEDFRQAFNQMDRGNQFSYEALELLYNFFEECDPDFELDVIAICCDFDEMDAEEVRNAYDLEEDTDVEDYLSYHTSLAGKTSEGFYVFQSF